MDRKLRSRSSDTLQVKGAELEAAAKLTPSASGPLRKVCAARLLSVLERAGRARAQTRASDNATETSAVELDAEQRQHARRGENEALKEAVAFLRDVQDAEVVHLDTAFHLRHTTLILLLSTFFIVVALKTPCRSHTARFAPS